MLLQFIGGTFQQKTLMLFVLAACETSYARGLKQMQLAADYSLRPAQSNCQHLWPLP